MNRHKFLQNYSVYTGAWFGLLWLGRDVNCCVVTALVEMAHIVQGKFALTWEILASKLQIGLWHLYGINRLKKKVDPPKLWGFWENRVYFFKKMIFFFYFFEFFFRFFWSNRIGNRARITNYPTFRGLRPIVFEL